MFLRWLILIKYCSLNFQEKLGETQNDQMLSVPSNDANLLNNESKKPKSPEIQEPDEKTEILVQVNFI